MPSIITFYPSVLHDNFPLTYIELILGARQIGYFSRVKSKGTYKIK